MFAVIKTGGKQYKVAPGDVVYVEKLDVEEGAEVKFGALIYSDDEGGVKVGTPEVDGVDVVAKAVGNVKGKKITVFKYKAKKNYRKKQGHRQPYTKLEVISVAGIMAEPKKAEDAAEEIKAEVKAEEKPKTAAKPKAAAKPAEKPKADAKPKAAAKASEKPKTAAKASDKPKAAAKPAEKPKAAAKPKAEKK